MTWAHDIAFRIVSDTDSIHTIDIVMLPSRLFCL